MRILLVEDNRMVRDMTHELLDMQGFTVLVAESPTQALELERQHTGTIDLLVTDIVMPGMNGPELYEQLVVQPPSRPALQEFLRAWSAALPAAAPSASMMPTILPGDWFFADRPFK